MRRQFLPLAAALVLVFVSACASGADAPVGDAEEPVEDPGAPEEEPEAAEIEGDITMARADWDTEFVVAEIHYLLLTELGYDVEHPENSELGAELFYQALDQRDIDFWANGWFPLHDPFFERTDNATQVGSQMLAGGFQGYLVDRATAEEHDITSIEQIAADPELQALFDFQGDGRADLVGCNAGWGCFEAIELHFDQAGLGDGIEQLSAEYFALMTDLIARYERGEPILYYTWTPNWTVGALVPGEDVVWIEASTHPDGEVPVDDVVGCVDDPCDIGWTANDIIVVANRDFLDEHPPAARLLELIEIPAGDVSAQNLLMEEGETTRSDIERHAQDWIEANRDVVDGWLEEARAAA